MECTLTFGKHWSSGLGDDFTVGDLQAENLMGEKEALTLHFGHLVSDWSDDYPAKKLAQSVHKFYGGMGEGAEFETWQDAVHASLYDAFQVYSELKNGDTFIAVYQDEIAKFVCQGVHVIAA